ncbi:hypothetical protein J5834_02005 [bacterium]|nr:hypothetical protein [bacterium]
MFIKTRKKIIAIAILFFISAIPSILLASADTSGIKSKFQEMADIVFDVTRYIGIYGGLGGAIISLLFRYINKDANIWSDALKILGAGAALAALSTILNILSGLI